MVPPLHQNSFSWLKRLTVSLAVSLIALSGLVLIGWHNGIDDLVQINPGWPPVKPNAATGFLVFGLALLAIEFGWQRLAWAAVLPGVLGLLTELQNHFPLQLGLDQWIARDHLQLETASPGRMATMVSLCFVLSGIFLPWFAARHRKRGRTVGLAFTGSVMVSVSFTTLIGYALSLPAVYRWGTATSLPPATAILLLILGCALLTLAWHTHQYGRPGAPNWLPMPAVIASATVTVGLWLGLREREFVYLGLNTQNAITNLASSINLEFERQAAALERVARRWGQTAESSPVIWEVDARLLLNDAPGCTAVLWMDAAQRTRWVYPGNGNEALLAFDHGTDPTRRPAIETARSSGAAAVSGSLALANRGPGFAVYAPILHENTLIGYAAADFLYSRFFDAIESRQKLGRNYEFAIYIGTEKLHGSAALVSGSRENRLESVYNIFGRRIRVEMSPSLENLRRNRRYLPELALGAGFGITLLLGLSIHLARTARTGLRAAEHSNLKLLNENEERRRIEEMLKLSDERLRLALDSTQIGIFEWNLPSNQLYYSASVWAMLGYHPDAVAATAEAWTALIHPDDLPAYRAAVERQLAGTVGFIDPEYRMRTAQREYRWVYARSKTVTRSVSGTPSRIIGTLQDITQRKQAEEALRLSQSTTRKLSLVAAKTDNIVIIGTPTGAIEWVNESFERLMEYSLDEVIGRNPAEFMIGPETRPRTVRLIRAALARGEGMSTDIVNYSKSGRKYYLHLEVQPVRNEAGELENFIAIEADITPRVETEQNLRRAKAEADAASKAKSDFLASMSHEIRTPMNGVIGMTSLLLDTSLNHEQRDYVQTIRTSGEALLTIINDILDFSKIESGKMELEQVPFELSVCLEDALDLFSVPAAAKKLELTYHIEEDVPAWILGDVTRLRQVLVNLVNNAVKFTPAGSIAILVRRLPGFTGTEERRDSLLLEFAVSDTGIGIPQNRTDRLFRPFSQIDSSTTRKYGGTGLGLAICQRLCALMGGEIGVTSTVGRGSVFRFTLRTEPVAMPPEWGIPELPAPLNYGPVLCIEDNPITQQRLSTFFKIWGARAICASTPEAALAILRDEVRPMAIVLDHDIIAQPGAEALLEHIMGCELPLLVLIPLGQHAGQLLAFTGRRGVTTTTKPLRSPSLVRAIRILFDAAPDSLPPFSAAADEHTLAKEIPLDVLLVEDNPVNQKVALRFLDRLGYRADAVANGLEAVNTLETRGYHLVLMDLQMPEMDGLEATRQIRRRLPPDRQPKIIALTANALQGDRDLCVDAGMDDYISKPVKLHEIADAIRRQFSPGSRTPIPFDLSR
jgi:PAS domain S-box-containing protein